MTKEELLEMLNCLQQDYDNLDLKYIDLLKENEKLKKAIKILEDKAVSFVLTEEEEKILKEVLEK